MSWDEAGMSDWMAAFRMLAGETLTGLLQAYEQVAQETAEVVRESLDGARSMG